MRQPGTFFKIVAGWTILIVLLLTGCNHPGGQDQSEIPSYPVTILNHTALDICQIHLSRPYQRAWGGNVLGNRLPSGACATVDIPAGMHDFQFVPCAETEPPLERYGVIVEGPAQFPLWIGYPPGPGVPADCSQPESLP